MVTHNTFYGNSTNNGSTARAPCEARSVSVVQDGVHMYVYVCIYIYIYMYI